jgi:Protein of unknown function (DUF3122)
MRTGIMTLTNLVKRWLALRPPGMLRTVCICMSLMILLLCGGVLGAESSVAAILHHEFAPGQMIYQSRQSMRDIDRHAWQVVLFKEVTQESADHNVNHVELRLVGFPGVIVFHHPEPLIIRTKTQQDFQAMDQFADQAPAANVGQYDLTDILPQLPLDEPLVLEIPTAQATVLKIPVSVVLEWKLIA